MFHVEHFKISLSIGGLNGNKKIEVTAIKRIPEEC